MYNSLEEIHGDIASRLARAAKDRHLPMHVPVVVTSDVDARSMVLREFNEETWALRFHTDIRAPKVAAIRANPRMAVLFYDKAAKVQIRVRGKGSVLGDAPVTDNAWDEATNFARRCYLGDGPGTASDTPTSGLPGEFEGVEPSDAQLVPARANFAVLRIELDALDWLYLAHSGHVRANFTRVEGDWQGSWVSP